MRNGHCARLLGVVNEVTLGVIFSILADDLDGVLVRADRAIRPQTIEHGTDYTFGFDAEIGIKVQPDGFRCLKLMMPDAGLGVGNRDHRAV